MSSRQSQIIIALLVVSIVLGGVNTYLIVSNQSAQDRVNEETATTLSGLSTQLSAAEAETASNYADLTAQIAATNENLSTLNAEVTAQGETLAAADASIQSSVSTLRENLNTLESQTPSKIYEDTYKSIVIVTTSTKLGSGFLYDSDKHIVTNWHVVEGATLVEVEYYDGTISTATIVGVDPYSDLAVILPETTPAGMTPLKLGNSTKVLIGDPVVAVGNPLGMSGSLSSGYISRKNVQIDVTNIPLIVNEFQLDLTIAPGSSGGALLNVDREVIGVTNAGYEGYSYSFAVPSNTVRRVADSIIEKGRYEHPRFGFGLFELSRDAIEYYNIFNVDSTQRGLMITEILAGFPAEAAGLQAAVLKNDPGGNPGYEAKDIVLAINGHTVDTYEEFVWYVEEYVSPGQAVDLTIWRAGAIIHVSVTPTAWEQYG